MAGLPKKKPFGKSSKPQGDKQYQNIGAIWSRTSKSGNEYTTLDFKVTDREGNEVGAILFMDTTGPEPRYYKLKSAGMQQSKSESPKAPLFNISIDLKNEFQVESLDEGSSEEG